MDTKKGSISFISILYASLKSSYTSKNLLFSTDAELVGDRSKVFTVDL